jgi:hypothetical protein
MSDLTRPKNENLTNYKKLEGLNPLPLVSATVFFGAKKGLNPFMIVEVLKRTFY